MRNVTEFAFVYSRKWTIPQAIVEWDKETLKADGYVHDIRTGHIITQSGVRIEIEDCLDFQFESHAFVRLSADRVSGGLDGVSRHGDAFHIGTPGHALDYRLIAAMEELEIAGIATPLPTKAINCDGWTAAEVYGGSPAAKRTIRAGLVSYAVQEIKRPSGDFRPGPIAHWSSTR